MNMCNCMCVTRIRVHCTCVDAQHYASTCSDVGTILTFGELHAWACVEAGLSISAGRDRLCHRGAPMFHPRKISVILDAKIIFILVPFNR